MKGLRRSGGGVLVFTAFGVLLHGCPKSAGGGAPAPPTRCELDPGPWIGSGTGAVARVAAQEDLSGSPTANGRAGDFLLANDRIRVVIDKPDLQAGPVPEGGNIVYADLVPPSPRRERYPRVGPFFNFGRTIGAEQVEVVHDGSAGGAAVVAAFGRDIVFRMVNLPGMAATVTTILKLPDVDRDMRILSGEYYILRPGEASVHMVQKLCNTGEETQVFAFGDLIDAGGLEYFAGGSGLFGAAGSSPSAVADSLARGVGEPFSGWVGPGIAYGYLPATDRNTALTITGVTGTVLGGTRLLDWVGRTETSATPEGAVVLEPGGSAVVEREFALARDLGGIFDQRYRRLSQRADPPADAKTGTLRGRVASAQGDPIAGARVLARAGQRTVSLFTTDSDGKFGGLVPAGSVQSTADDGVVRSVSVDAAVAEGANVDVEIAMPPVGAVSVGVRDDAGTPIPAKLTVVCEGSCPAPRGDNDAQHMRDEDSDRLPSGTIAIRYLDPSGEATLTLPVGRYTVHVSRGPEWSLQSTPIEVSAAATVPLAATLSHVVDTTGWMSGDFHVHAIDSPDSPVPNAERLRTFMAEGVDVIVSTDHDFVTDFAPILAGIQRGDEFIATISGVELTTFDYGHFNAFPLQSNPVRRNFGAPDWGGGRYGPALMPGTIFEALGTGQPDRVVQVNHGRGGYFSMLGLDTRTLWTRGEASIHRIKGPAPDPATGDTRLFDPRFTAMEVMNGFGRGGFVALTNDWFSLLSRGLRRTATAVSDTHKRHGNSGYPRTWVRVGRDAPRGLGASDFARAVNAGRATGSNGPFVLLKASAGTTSAEVGDVLVSGGAPVTVDVEVRTPAWMQVNRVDIYVNSTGTETRPDGSVPSSLPEPRATLPLSGETLGEEPKQWRRATASTKLELAADAWIVAIVSGEGDMFPVVGKGGATPLAFTNPVLVDVGGDGWTPPVELAAERARVGSLGQQSQPLSTAPSEAEVREIFAADRCGQ